MSDSDAVDELSDDERTAVEEIERGLEQFHRAHGSLVAFHHAVGSAMEHFDEAERHLRDEHGDLAARLSEEVLPAGVTADEKLTYELVAEFEDGLLETVEATADRAFEELADGRRYPLERSEHDGSEDDESGE